MENSVVAVNQWNLSNVTGHRGQLSEVRRDFIIKYLKIYTSGL